MHMLNKRAVFVARDFDARVGRKPDYIMCDTNVSDLDFYLYNPDQALERASLDQVCNARGNRLIDLCKATSMRIVNGRLGSDYGTGN